MALSPLPGVKITNTAGIAAAGLDAPRIAQRATESYLIQILRHGFFHAGELLLARFLCWWLQNALFIRFF